MGEGRAFATRRWTGVGAVALGMIALATVTRRPAALLVAAVAVAYAGHATLARPPAGSDGDGPPLAFDRSLSDESPKPGEEVTVTVTVRNRSDRWLPDVRVVDRVPDALAVVDGSPSFATFLRPGGSASSVYTVAANSGGHVWESARAVVRNGAGTAEREHAVGGRTRLRCSPASSEATDLPLRGLTNPFSGRLTTDVAGGGVQFYGVREYRVGDPRRRIDWRRLARTGDLATTQFHEERAATVVLLLDARKAAYLAPEPDAESAVERSVGAAVRTFDALLDGGDRVGIAAFGRSGRRRDGGPDGRCWLSPGAGDEHRTRGRELLTTHPTLSPTPPEEAAFAGLKPDRQAELRRRRVDRLHRRLDTDAQVVFFSPCGDDYPVTVARRLDARGHAVTLVSPDPTPDGTAGSRVAAVERVLRLDRLRRDGCRVVDWPGDASLAAAVGRAERRWSA